MKMSMFGLTALLISTPCFAADKVSIHAALLINPAQIAIADGEVSLSQLEGEGSCKETIDKGIYYRAANIKATQNLKLAEQPYVLESVQIRYDSATCDIQRAIGLHLNYAHSQAPDVTLSLTFNILRNSVEFAGTMSNYSKIFTRFPILK